MPAQRHHATEARCECGWVLIDDIGPVEIAVAGRSFPLRRSTDHVLCPACGELHRIIDLRLDASEPAQP